MEKHLKQIGIVIAGTVLTKIVYDTIRGDKIADKIRTKAKSAYQKLKKSNGRDIPGVQ